MNLSQKRIKKKKKKRIKSKKKKSNKSEIKEKIKSDAGLLAEGYKEILNKFSDMSQQDMSMASKGNNISSFGGSFLKGNTSKEKEVNVMMNLVE